MFNFCTKTYKYVNMFNYGFEIELIDDKMTAQK
jgi:hypothetical protein